MLLEGVGFIVGAIGCCVARRGKASTRLSFRAKFLLARRHFAGKFCRGGLERVDAQWHNLMHTEYGDGQVEFHNTQHGGANARQQPRQNSCVPPPHAQHECATNVHVSRVLCDSKRACRVTACAMHLCSAMWSC
eukprot:scaffold16438_cov144-Isochrysis_galbana.AAC.1